MQNDFIYNLYDYSILEVIYVNMNNLYLITLRGARNIFCCY
jgi:hypothetical protein